MTNYIKTADLHALMQKYTNEEMSFSKIVEELNAIVNRQLQGFPPKRLAKMDTVRALEAHQSTFTMTKELSESLSTTLDLMKKGIASDLDTILSNNLK